MNSICPLLTFALTAHAFAQSPLQPREPVLSPAPARSEWTVRVTSQIPDSWAADHSWEAQGNAGPAAPEAKAIRSITYAKDAASQAYQVTTRWNTGETEEEWVIMGQHVAERPGGKGLYIVASERLLAQEITTVDFPELAWVERKHFVGVRTYKGRQVFVFEEAFNRKRMTPTEARQYFFAQQADPKVTPDKVFKPRFDKVTAYLDAVTQLPVLCNDGRNLYTYTFRATDAGRLRPPQKIVDFLRQHQEFLKARLTPPVGPGTAAQTSR
jgi:hypothetical protein